MHSSVLQSLSLQCLVTGGTLLIGRIVCPKSATYCASVVLVAGARLSCRTYASRPRQACAQEPCHKACHPAKITKTRDLINFCPDVSTGKQNHAMGNGAYGASDLRCVRRCEKIRSLTQKPASGEDENQRLRFGRFLTGSSIATALLPCTTV